ncbi:hypothetical protein LMG23992_03718 [Cupriavidus laharis]|uniref:HTH cro/C1-type domain-containing protein n=1 Tax=Cupriavidus laharis TaxID=151654 RepID=A0ABN7YYY0_9BURK|nr:HigA family addiction module antitoxin [Cupriavidus laharis]CAG9178308.1 hypothetical protein LMG23992_03718 [Cupriavidus laharis]
MGSTRVPAEVFPPGEFLKEELEARGWTQTEFAEIIDKDTRLVSEVIGGKRAVTPETAVAIGEALGTGPELWMNLESQYQLSKVRNVGNDIARKARLHAAYPVREMVKRGWLQATRNVDVLQQELFNFFEISGIDERPRFLHAARKASYENITSQQFAWLFRARSIAETLAAKPYSEEALRKVIPTLRSLMNAPEDAAGVTALLTSAGVRVVFIETLPGSKIDGACFWLDARKPVIAMSLRHDRIDNFWFVLRHELEHVLRGHGKAGVCLDQEVDNGQSNELPEEERVANAEAEDFCVPKAQLDDFVAEVGPFFTDERVCLFAQRMQVHPGVVVGQLQRRIHRYDLLKKHQVKVRSVLTAAGPTDGWGHSYPTQAWT